LRIKEQETHLTLQEHDDDDDNFIIQTIYENIDTCFGLLRPTSEFDFREFNV